MKILFKYPTRGRPVWFIKTLDMFMHMFSCKHEIEFLIAMDNDDLTMNTDLMRDYLEQIKPPPDSPAQLRWFYGDHRGKVEAVNSGIMDRMIEGEFDIVCVISDDIEPQQSGYDDVMAQSMTESFPDLDGIIYFDDSRCHRRVVTIPIMGRPMYMRLGDIVNPAFIAWGDNDSTKRFKKTRKLKYYDHVLLKHCWCKYNARDATYMRAAKHRYGDAKRYKQLMDSGAYAKDK